MTVMFRVTDPIWNSWAKIQFREPKPCHLVDVGAGHRAGDELGDAEVGALQDEERPQRDQEARECPSS